MPDESIGNAFDLAVQKLIGGTPRYELVNLPLDVTSPLWDSIEKQYNLTIPEQVGVLQNYVHGQQQQQQQPNGKKRLPVVFVHYSGCNCLTIYVCGPDSPINRTAYMTYLPNPNKIMLPRDMQLFEASSLKRNC